MEVLGENMGEFYSCEKGDFVLPRFRQLPLAFDVLKTYKNSKFVDFWEFH